jgi:hypothetical protein
MINRPSLALTLRVGLLLLVSATSLAATKPSAIYPTTQQDARGEKIEPIVPDEKFQRQFSQILEAMREGHNNGYGVYVREVGVLLDLTEQEEPSPAPGIKLCRQLLYYLIDAPEGGKQRMPTVLKLARIMTLVSAADALIAADPFVESEDPVVREAAAVVMSAGGAFEADYGYDRPGFFSYILNRYSGDSRTPARTPPTLVVRGMFSVNPISAVRTLKVILREDLTDQETTQLGNQVAAHHAGYYINNQASEGRDDEREKGDLRQLARSRHWWIRLYVAELMCRHQNLRVPDLIEQLKRDENDLVRARIEAVRQDQPKTSVVN